jgi:O-phospho-L-seryl-tRNASec:L-selenocysteinyl-tRNA synthase
VVRIGELCKLYKIFHIVNNAYGVHSTLAMSALSKCYRSSGQLDLIIQSMDKNFMVPVGGSIIVGPSAELVDSMASMFPGRASISPIMDLFITLLSMGIENFKQLREKRQVGLTR